jgi:hopanoid biosynthesis associated protein HpnK
MVGGAAAADAVRRARLLPSLKVGLHLALVDSRPVSPATSVPDLIDAEGNFRRDMVATSIAIALNPKVRRQVALEIAAQYAQFQATGLQLDHVDAHKHFHLHPMIAALICRIGRQYGMRALRAPVEPAASVWRAEQALVPAARLRPNLSTIPVNLTRRFATKLQRQIRRQGFKTADQVFGLAWSGAINVARLCALIPYLPEGVTEIYCHPATADAFVGGAPGYRYRDELAALLEPRVAEAVQVNGLYLTAYSDLA